jgi:thiamine pyrophosphokinase
MDPPVMELLGQLLRMVSTSCVLDSAMERVMELDIKVDVLLGFDIDFDAKLLKEKQYPRNSTYSRSKQNRS